MERRSNLDTPYLFFACSAPSSRDHHLAQRHLPLLRFDLHEPFLPLVVGYTVFHESAPSPSFPRRIVFTSETYRVIEYAIWWDWDIQHLYELEHLWIWLDRDEKVIKFEGSWHGDFHVLGDSCLTTADGRLVAYSEPGKHAFAQSPQPLLARASVTRTACTAAAGRGGVLITPLFEGIIRARNAFNNRLVHTFCEDQRFEPSYDFSKVVDLRYLPLVSWYELKNWIPQRVETVLAELRSRYPITDQRMFRIVDLRGQFGSLSEFAVRVKEASADGIKITMVPDGELGFAIPGTHGKLSPEEVFHPLMEAQMNIYLQLEPFPKETLTRLLDVVRELGVLGHLIFGSRSVDCVQQIKHHAPNAMTALEVHEIFSQQALRQSQPADYVCGTTGKSITREWVERFHAVGIGLIAETYHGSLQAAGVDGVCNLSELGERAHHVQDTVWQNVYQY